MTSTPQSSGVAAPPGDRAPTQYADTEVRSLGGLVTALTVLLALCAVTSLAYGIATYSRAGLIDAILAGRIVTDAEANLADTLTLGLGVVDGVAVLGTGVVFIVWFWRLLKNARWLDRSAPAAGWAIGSWFIPVANLVLPALFMYRADRISGSRGRSVGALIVSWAVFFGVGNILSRVLWRDTSDEVESLADLELLASADRRDGWLQLVFVAAAVAAVFMVHTISSRQRGAIAERQEQLRVAEETRRSAWQPPLPAYRSAGDRDTIQRVSPPAVDTGGQRVAPADPSAPPDPRADQH